MIGDRRAIEEFMRVELRIILSQQCSGVLQHFVKIILAQHNVRLEPDRLEQPPTFALLLLANSVEKSPVTAHILSLSD